MIVAASPEGVLVTNRDGSARIKPYVDKLNTPVMFAEKSWGEYKVIDVSNESMTVRITLEKDREMSYHSHQNRREVWTIVSGNGTAVLDGVVRKVSAGDVLSIEAGMKHTIKADSDVLEIIEVQIGRDISVSDKKKWKL